MQVLQLKFKEEEPYLEYTEGEIFSSYNYVRECCESNYAVDFKYKGITLDEEIVITALTHHYNKFSDTVITVDKLNEMFNAHDNKRENEDELTEIKKITLEYLRKVLFD